MKIFVKILSLFGLTFCLILLSCKRGKTSDIGLVVLDPGHFHSSLVLQDKIDGIRELVYVYAPKGEGVEQYLKSVESYNEREKGATAWKNKVYIGEDYLGKMLSDKKGEVVVLAGDNQKKTKYILESVKAGYHVLSDKPMAICEEDFELLRQAYEIAGSKGLVIYELMTERYDILNIVEKKIMGDTSVFGTLVNGTKQKPAIDLESVHHFYKKVSGKPLIRPAWYYDVKRQGEGLADVTTHLIDLVQWQCFPEQGLDSYKDIELLEASRYPTKISREQFSRSTKEEDFPDYLKSLIKDESIEVMANGSMDFKIKGIHSRISVKWNYEAPEGGGDSFYSIKRGTKATLNIIQSSLTGFTRQLFISDANNVDKKDIENLLDNLKAEYPFISFKKTGAGNYMVDIPAENRLVHTEHFGRVARKFFGYIREGGAPAWEKENVLSKYRLTTQAVKLSSE